MLILIYHEKILSTLCFVLGVSTAVFSQFSENGYKKLKIGMTIEENVNQFEMEVGGDNISYVEIDGVELEVYFRDSYTEGEYTVSYISTQDIGAKLMGTSTPVVGKKIADLKKNLADKLEPFVMSENLYYFYATTGSKSSEKVCMLETDVNSVETGIFTTYHQ